MNISISEIEAELPKYGIDYIKLNSYNIMLENFKQSYNTGKIPTYFTRFMGGKEYEYSNYKMNQKMSYQEVKPLGSGSWNETFIHKDTKGNEYIIKKSIINNNNKNTKPLLHNEKIEKLFDGFYENIKHIILYIIITKYVGNIKLFPKPYYCGFLKSPTNSDIDNIEHIIVMEKGYKTVDKYIKSLSLPATMFNIKDTYEEQQYKLEEYKKYEIKKIIVNIYHYLILINRLTLINFKHNDLKFDNIVMASESSNTPLLIDFGLTAFQLNLDNRLINFVRLDIGNEDPVLPFGYNSILDIMQLISSFYLISNNSNNTYPVPFYEILMFTQNKDSNILDSKNLQGFFLGIWNYYTVTLRKYIDKYQLFRAFYIQINLLILKNIMNENNLNCSFFIEPVLLAYNIGLSYDDIKIIKYQNKYLKYKMKYLILKKSMKTLTNN